MTLFTPGAQELQLDPQPTIQLVKDFDIIFGSGSTYEAYLTVVIHGLLRNYSLLGAGCSEREVEDLAFTSERPLIAVIVDSIAQDSGTRLINRVKHQSPRTKAILIADNLEKIRRNRSSLPIYDGIVSSSSIGRGGLMRCIEAITSSNERFIDHALGAEINDEKTDELATLNQRERQILPLLARGLKNKEIAQELYIAETTARDYVSSILLKLQLSNRAAAAAWTIERGLAA